MGGDTRELLAEEATIVGFEGAPEQARQFVGKVVDATAALTPHLDTFAAERAKALQAVHRQLRDESRIKGLTYDVRPQLSADVLGVYVLLPTGLL